jgi:hypothetical protein
MEDCWAFPMNLSTGSMNCSKEGIVIGGFLVRAVMMFMRLELRKISDGGCDENVREGQ